MSVSIVVCFRSGTEDMLRVCTSNIQAHTKVDYELILVNRDSMDDEELADIHYDRLIHAPVGDLLSGSHAHGAMLDYVIPDFINTDLVLTLDSDCFPIADGWLADLLEMKVGIAGILHPWAPPPEDMEHNKIEWRVRSQHCWKTTHVACQLVGTEFFWTMGDKAKYKGGDDTGLLIPKLAKESGMTIGGFMPTRCAKPIDDNFDAEFNRYVCMVWGDKMYHQGGFTRTSVGKDVAVFEKNFGWVLPKIMEEGGAEWILDEGFSHQFQFDKEEEVSAEKMQRLFGLSDQRLDG